MDVEQQKTNFVKRVLIDEPEKCWLWLGGKTTLGYGIFSMGVRNKKEYAHRASYRLFKGDVPKRLCILHACDNPSCVNPDHLSLGTRAENIKDAQRKKRMRHGSRHGMAKLNEKSIADIRQAVASGQSVKELVQVYGCSDSTIHEAVNGNTWKHVDAPLPPSKTKREIGLKYNIRGEKHCCAKLTEKDVRTIRQLLKENCLGVDIAREFGVIPSTISDIKHRRTWRHLE